MILKDKVVIITGAGQWIGRTHAHRFCKEGLGLEPRFNR